VRAQAIILHEQKASWGCPYHRQDWSEESSAGNAERRTYLHHRNRISRFVQSPRSCELSWYRDDGSYEELLADPNIDVVYDPLPNQLHVPWTIKAAEAGKHVLCEKPISLTVAEAETLLDVRVRTGVKIGEGFMIRTAPQWLRLRDVLRKGRIGTLRSVMGIFSYFNDDPSNIRNKTDCGGGGLMDIGCYLVLASRYAF
jgi:predicted dehydrogenase